MTIALSILDQTPVGEDCSPAQALRDSVQLAQAVDGLGFTRYWAAEHHVSPGFAGSAPEILAGALLDRTRHMRIGNAAELRVFAGEFHGAVLQPPRISLDGTEQDNPVRHWLATALRERLAASAR
jgi:hypothetical protein